MTWCGPHQIPGEFAFDSYFTSASSLNHLQGHGRGYVGDLKSNRKVKFRPTTGCRTMPIAWKSAWPCSWCRAPCVSPSPG